MQNLPETEKADLNKTFGPIFVENPIDGYTLIAQAQEKGELLVHKFRTKKPLAI